MTAEVLKFDPSEPRDTAGRWTDGGGMISADEARTRLTAMWPSLNKPRFSYDPPIRDGLDTINRVLLSQTVRQLESLHAKFPGVRLDKFVAGYIPGERRAVVARTASREATIQLNGKLYAGGLVFDKVTTGDWIFRTPGAPAAADVITHEFAHLVDFQYMSHLIGPSGMAYWTGGDTPGTPIVSRYASTNPNERFAEAFVAAQADQSSPAGQWWANLWPQGSDRYAPPITKFDPSEPRDEAGRWTTSGPFGSGIAEYVAAHPGTRIGKGVASADPAKMGPMLRQLGSLQDRFPSVNIYQVDVKPHDWWARDERWQTVAMFIPGPGPMSDREREMTRQIAAQAGWPEPDFHPGGSIYLNGTFMGASRDVPTAGFTVADGIDGVITHEFGHAVDTDLNRLSQQGDPVGKAWTDWETKAAEIYNGPDADLLALYHVSAYARAGPFKEAVAEVFAAAYSSGSDPSTWSPATAAAVESVRSILSNTGFATKVAKVAGSPLTFSTQATQLLRDAAAAAYETGYSDAGEYDGTWADLADGMGDVAVDQTVDGWGSALVGLAALLIGGAISEAMLGSRLDNYTSGLYGLYNEGFGTAVSDNAPGSTVEWAAAGDDKECDPCDERDGQEWPIDGDYPYPGSGRFGSDICRGGPNCRCELIYHIDEGETPDVALDSGDDLTLAAGVDLTTFTVAELASLRALLAKYSPDQPRDAGGRWTTGGVGAPLYHVSPIEARVSIRRYGIDPSRMHDLSGYEWHSPETPGGFYVFSDLETARWYADYMAHMDPVGPMDIWEVPGVAHLKPDYGLMMGGSDSQDDPANEASWFHPGTARPSRLLETAGESLRKYSPDQPRDDRGRFTDGAHSDDEAILALGDDKVRWAARDWSGGGFAHHGYQAVRDALAAYLDQGTFGDHSTYEHGVLLVKAANAAPPTTYPLYRGIGLDEMQVPDFQRTFVPGARVDLNLSSWTRDSLIAQDFALNKYMTQDASWMDPGNRPDHPVIFTLAPGAHAYDATNDITQGPQYTEHLTAGRFEVVGVTHWGGQMGAVTVPEGDTVTLRQVDTLNPSQLIGTKVAL